MIIKNRKARPCDYRVFIIFKKWYHLGIYQYGNNHTLNNQREVPMKLRLLLLMCTFAINNSCGAPKAPQTKTAKPSTLTKKNKKKRMNNKLKVGDKAPDFSLKDETGSMHKLSDLSGTNVALYFYPKDQTPGCTAQACSIRDGFVELKKAGIVVLGVSYDSPESHKKFKEKHQLNFPLLSDSDKSVSKLYNVSGYFMPDRVTFLIDKTGRIVKILKDVDVKDHAHEIIKAFNI